MQYLPKECALDHRHQTDRADSPKYSRQRPPSTHTQRHQGPGSRYDPGQKKMPKDQKDKTTENYSEMGESSKIYEG
eukprot:11420020-Karenia_brevis.AAC.1